MIEKTVRDYLTEQLAEPVLLEVPEDRPLTYVIIEKTGSGEENRLQRATLAIRSVAPTLYEAAVLNNEVKAAMDGLRALPNVFHCHRETDYNFTNTRTKERRYQAVFHVYYLERS